MTCEEFEAIGLDGGRDASLSGAECAAAATHAASCSRCAALRDSWEAVRADLRFLAQATSKVEAPPRIEMRLRQQFRTQYHTMKLRRTAVVTAWALAAAAALIVSVSWVSWHSNSRRDVAGNSSIPSSSSGTSALNQQPTAKNSDANSETLVADNELSDFTFLPGVLPADTEDSAILSVRLQRGALGTLGLPVNEDRAAEWIQVDLLVGNDGLPQAVRLPESQ